MANNKLYGTTFYGNEASDYAKEQGRLDYATLAKAFDAVLNNDIIKMTSDIGYWETENGSEEYYENNNGNIYTYDEKEEKVRELEEEKEELEDRMYEFEELEEGETDEYYEEVKTRLAEIDEEIEALEDAHYDEIFQYYIISDEGARILKDWTNEIVFYNEALDMYVWGVTHWGTSWSYVLTDIKLNCGEGAYNW